MEAQMEIQDYLEQGRAALTQGKAREAAVAYANGAQLEPNSPAVHLGLAEANLALGNYAVVQMASHRVLELQPGSGYEAKIAQALLELLDHRYERALQSVEAAISEDPSVAYFHALRSYLLSANGQDYDANLARARATRLSYGGRFDNCFPALEVVPAVNRGYGADPGPGSLPADSNIESSIHAGREAVPNWSRPNAMRRQTIRTRFFLNQNPGFVTNVIIAVVVAMYLLSSMVPAIYSWGAFDPGAILSGQVWRFVTSIFIYTPGPEHLLGLLFNVLSLFFVGRAVEIFYGPYRYLSIYLLVGTLGNVASLFLILFAGYGFVLGPLASLLGIFGAIGVFYFANRRGLGVFGTSAITSWLFWLVLNLALNLPAIGIEIFCILAGMIIAYILLPRSDSGRGRSLF